MVNQDLMRSAARLPSGQDGQIALVKNNEFDYLLLSWAPHDDSEPEDYIIMSDKCLRNIDGSLTLTDDSDSVVFECVLEAESVEKWTCALRQALNTQFSSESAIEEEERTRQMMRDALTQFARDHAASTQQQPKERSLNSFVKSDLIAILMEDEAILAKLAEHIPEKALGNRTLKETLTKICRSTEFRNAGEELSRALYTPDYAAIYRLLGLTPPSAEIHFEDPVMSLLTCLIQPK